MTIERLGLKAQLAAARQRIAELEALAPRWRSQTNGATHWEGCWNEHRVCALRKIAELEGALADMTADRDLWMDGHNEDCPNAAQLGGDQQRIAELEKQLAGARRETIEECAAEAHVRIGHLSPEVPIDYDNGAEELGWNQACTDIEAAMRALAEAQDDKDYQGYCLKRAHPETPNIVCLCRTCAKARAEKKALEEK